VSPQREEIAIPTPKQVDQQAVATLQGPPLVALYNTHTGETYALTDGVERLNGKRGGIVKVTEALQQCLEQQHHIKVARVDKIHDQVYNKSYLESEKTVQKLLTDHPELKLVLDIHRDSGRPRQDCFVEINGEKVAKIMIVVGSDARAEFPNWQQNLVLARQITDRLDEKYPGLSFGIRVQEGRYNQHYHTGALLFEVGSVENTTDEAIRAAKLLAGVLAENLTSETIESD
jgi:stage II sporulation protein P